MNASQDPNSNKPVDDIDPIAAGGDAASNAAGDAAGDAAGSAAGDAPESDASEAMLDLHAQAERADRLADRLKRVEAEFVNESKRLRRQADDQKKYAIERVVIDLIPLIDSVHTGISKLGDSDVDQGMREGLDLIGKQLLEILGRHGVKPIEALGRPFDPSLHEALFTQPCDDVEPQTVVDVLRPGFTLNERVVRAAEVAVSVAPPEAAGAPPEAADRSDA